MTWKLVDAASVAADDLDADVERGGDSLPLLLAEVDPAFHWLSYRSDRRTDLDRDLEVSLYDVSNHCVSAIGDKRDLSTPLPPSPPSETSIDTSGRPR